jgi:hypothetical protein
MSKPSASTRRLLEELPAFKSLSLEFGSGAEDVGTIVDRLGRAAAARAVLEGYEKQLREIIVEHGAAATEGRLFRATLSTFDQTRLDTSA